MKSSEIITEKFVNLINQNDKRKYATKVWDMIEKTYERVGRLPMNTLDNLIATPGIWKIVTRDGNITAGIVYRDYKGRKIRLVFQDGTSRGKDDLKLILKQDIIKGRAWGEFSGPLEKVMISLGGKMIPNTEAESILNMPIEELDPDGFHYTRKVDGQTLKREVLIGDPKQEEH